MLVHFLTIGSNKSKADHVAGIQPNESLNTDSDYRRVAGPNNGHIIAPMILPGDGVPLLLAARADDMSDISENHSRAPEEILNSTWDHRTEIWAIGFYVSARSGDQEKLLTMYPGMGLCQSRRNDRRKELKRSF